VDKVDGLTICLVIPSFDTNQIGNSDPGQGSDQHLDSGSRSRKGVRRAAVIDPIVMETCVACATRISARASSVLYQNRRNGALSYHFEAVSYMHIMHRKLLGVV
jgi:hypothetical protein